MPANDDFALNADLEAQINQVRDVSELSEAECKSLCERAREILQEESN
eukprot:CAMPEP_0179255242 /NCGR_PEP_ID=MMETSP0797-20121207/23649_1 /TAXON_ID=47934 /ORGANISM="Dinophysis acuminata, Strain DAEP01" /LENGTH=47 /DNA_ID= /DNA_START= /DNA_END= /DNA_ORIENTATION=